MTRPLTPTEDLILSVVTSRYILGEPFYSIERRNKRALDSLVARGLVEYRSGPNAEVFQVTATPAALVAHLAVHVPPALKPYCTSTYTGPKMPYGSLTCRLDARHAGDHEGVYLARGPITTWTDEESGGRAEPWFADQRAALDRNRPQACGAPFDYLAYDITVTCDLAPGHESQTGERHLWAGDHEFRPWIKPIAWTAADVERAAAHTDCPHGGPCRSNRGLCPRGR